MKSLALFFLFALFCASFADNNVDFGTCKTHSIILGDTDHAAEHSKAARHHQFSHDEKPTVFSSYGNKLYMGSCVSEFCAEDIHSKEVYSRFTSITKIIPLKFHNENKYVVVLQHKTAHMINYVFITNGTLSSEFQTPQSTNIPVLGDAFLDPENKLFFTYVDGKALKVYYDGAETTIPNTGTVTEAHGAAFVEYTTAAIMNKHHPIISYGNSTGGIYLVHCRDMKCTDSSTLTHEMHNFRVMKASAAIVNQKDIRFACLGYPMGQTGFNYALRHFQIEYDAHGLSVSPKIEVLKGLKSTKEIAVDVFPASPYSILAVPFYEASASKVVDLDLVTCMSADCDSFYTSKAVLDADDEDLGGSVSVLAMTQHHVLAFDGNLVASCGPPEFIIDEIGMDVFAANGKGEADLKFTYKGDKKHDIDFKVITPVGPKLCGELTLDENHVLSYNLSDSCRNKTDYTEKHQIRGMIHQTQLESYGHVYIYLNHKDSADEHTDNGGPIALTTIFSLAAVAGLALSALYGYRNAKY